MTSLEMSADDYVIIYLSILTIRRKQTFLPNPIQVAISHSGGLGDSISPLDS